MVNIIVITIIIIIIIIIVVVVIIIIIIIIIIIPKQLKLNFPLKYIRCPYCSVIKWWLVHKLSTFSIQESGGPIWTWELRRRGVCQYLLPAVVRSWSRNGGLQTILSLLSACPVICILFFYYRAKTPLHVRQVSGRKTNEYCGSFRITSLSSWQR